jgi:hypothetical protein
VADRREKRKKFLIGGAAIGAGLILGARSGLLGEASEFLMKQGDAIASSIRRWSDNGGRLEQLLEDPKRYKNIYSEIKGFYKEAIDNYKPKELRIDRFLRERQTFLREYGSLDNIGEVTKFIDNTNLEKFRPGVISNIYEKISGARRATIGDLINMGRGNEQLEKLVKRNKDFLFAAADPGLFVQNGKLVDMRGFTRIPGKIMEFLEPGILGKIGHFRDMNFAREAPMISVLRGGKDGVLQPMITGSMRKLGASEAYLYSGGKIANLFDVSDVKKGEFMLTSGRYGTMQRIVSKRGGLISGNLPPKDTPLNKVLNFFDIGGQGTPTDPEKAMSFFTKFGDENWINNIFRKIKEDGFSNIDKDDIKSFDKLRAFVASKTRPFRQSVFDVLTEGAGLDRVTVDTKEGLIESLKKLGADKKSRLHKRFKELSNDPDALFRRIGTISDRRPLVGGTTVLKGEDILRKEIGEDLIHRIGIDDSRRIIDDALKAGKISRRDAHIAHDLITKSTYDMFYERGLKSKNLEQRLKHFVAFINGNSETSQRFSKEFQRLINENAGIFHYGIIDDLSEELIDKSTFGEFLAVRRSPGIISAIEELIRTNDATKLKAWLKQLAPGVGDWENFSTLSAIPYHLLSRLDDGISNVGIPFIKNFADPNNRKLDFLRLGFSKASTGSTGNLAFSLLTKRILPIAGLIGAAKYASWELGNFTGLSMEQRFARLRAQFNLDRAALTSEEDKTDYELRPGIDQLGELPIIGTFFKEPRTYEEEIEFLKYGNEPVRKGRYWLLSRGPYSGGKIESWVPNYYRMGMSEWQYTDTLYGEGGHDYWSHSWLPTPRYPMAPLRRILDPYWLERCVAEGTPITLSDGSIVNIEDINIGDSVITFNGTPSIVENKWSSTIDEEVITITPSMFNDFPITSTVEHRYLAIRATYCEKLKSGSMCVPGRTSHKCHNCKDKFYKEYTKEWIRADKLKVGDYLVIPKPKLQETLEEIDVYFNDRGYTTGRQINLPAKVPANEKLFLLFGYYLAEGHINQRSIVFSFSYNEMNYCLEVAEIVKELFGVKAITNKVKNKNVIKVTISNSRLVKFFKELLGSRAENKKIHPLLMTAKKECLLQLVRGFFIGNGTHKGYKNTISATTISKNLASQLKHILMSLGYVPSMNFTKAYIYESNGYSRNNKEKFRIYVHGDDANNLRKIIGWPVLMNTAPSKWHFEDDEYIYIKIVGVSRKKYSGNIYDLKIKDNFSFMSIAAILHNTHYYDRPYPFTGDFFEPNTPWGVVLNPTIGQMIKPNVPMHKESLAEINNQIRQWASEKERIYGITTTSGATQLKEVNYINTVNDPSAPAGTVVMSPGVYGTPSGYSGSGNVVYTGGAVSTGTSQAIEQLNAINFNILDKSAGIPKGGSWRNAYLGEDQLNDQYLTKRVIDPTGLGPRLADLNYVAREIMGVYGWGSEVAFGSPYTEKWIAQKADRMGSMERRFWDKNLGGFGGSISEIGRRFLPHERHDVNYWNPIPNQMPDWLPGMEHFVDLRHGDPYAKLRLGEVRLPGAAYEATHELHPDEFGEYGAFDRFAILANVAPYSDQYRVWSKIASQTVEDPELRKQMARIREETNQQKDKYRVYPYKFADAEIEKETVTVDRFLDPSTFTTAEYPNAPIRLAGVRLSKDRPLSDFIERGEKVVVGLNKDVEARIENDTLGTMHAVVYNKGQNINKMLIDRKIGRELEDESPVGIRARYSTKEIQEGTSWELNAHRNIPLFSNKFLNVQSPLEFYERELVYGKEWSSWSTPIKSYIQPTLESARNRDPIRSAGLMSITGAIIGKLFGGTWSRAAWGAGIAAGIGAISSIVRIADEITSRENWIPERRIKEREINEYFDILKYMKARGLYEYAVEKAYTEEGIDVEGIIGSPEKEGRQRTFEIFKLKQRKRELMLDNRDLHSETIKDINRQIRELENYKDFLPLTPWTAEAMKYRDQMEATLYGGSPFGNFQDFYSALPRKDKEFARTFMAETDPKKRKKILELVPENQRRYYQAHWGMKIDERPDLYEYFQEHTLPDANWEGWSPDVNLDSVKLKVVKNEALELSEFNMWPEDEQKAAGAPEISDIHNANIDPFKLQRSIEKILAGRGLQNVQVSFYPVTGSGISIDMDIEHDRTQEIEEYMTRNFIRLLG